MCLPGNKYIFKVITRNTRKKCEKLLNLTINDLEYISLVFLLLTLNMYLFTGGDIRVGFNDCIILFDYPRSMK